jgi:GAF domain-containing protein
MKSLIGDSPIVVHDAGQWRRFLRAELRTIKRHGAANLMNNVVDVSAWAHQRFPRRRKDVAAIARRVGVEIPDDMSGLALEVELLRRIGRLISGQPVVTEQIASVTEMSISGDVGVDQAPPVRINWVERVGCFWRTLMGNT